MSNEAAKRAAELVEQAWTEFDTTTQDATLRALRNLIQHVSDVAERVCKNDMGSGFYDDLRALILPKPADPLVEALEEALARTGEDLTEHADRLRASLAKRGLRIASDGVQG